MTVGTLALVSLAGGLGAGARLLIGRSVAALAGGHLHLGTMAVNLSGAFLLGLLVGAAPSSEAQSILGTGLLGGYTTFSTWMYESQRLGRQGRGGALAVNLIGSLLLGLAAVWLGRSL